MDKQFQNIKVPVISENTKINADLFLLLRQNADSESSYQTDSIIERLIDADINDKSFKLFFIYELAANENLRNQLKQNILFNDWLHEASKVIIID